MERTEQIHIDHENALFVLRKCEYTTELFYIHDYTLQEYKTSFGSHEPWLP